MRRLSDVVEMLAHQSANDCWAKVVQTPEHESMYDITWASLQKAVESLSTFMESELEDNNKERTTLAYLATSDVRCAATIIAAIRTGTQLLLLSSRNSPDINQGLLDATSCKYLLYSSEYRQQAHELSNSFSELHCHELGSYQDYFETGGRSEHDKSPRHELDDEKTALILHSSGTTGRPKPIRITYGALAHMDKISSMPSPEGRSNKYNEMFSNKTMVGALPFFHVMGLVLLARSIYSQGRLVLLPQNQPPTAKAMIAAIRQSKPASAILVPSMLKDICDMAEGLDVLSSLQDVWYGGGPLDRACGDKVSGVTRILCGYGSTEMMTVFTLLPRRAEDWEYLEWHPEAGVLMEEVTETTSEMVIKRKPDWEWQSVFYNFPQLSEWRSDDLFERHPSNAKLWRHIGRKDDLLVLSNGEKINPTSIETSIRQHPMVRDVLVFGSGRFQVGVLLEIDEGQKEQNDKDNSISQIWPTIDETNKGLPGHAKIWQSMALLASHEKPFERNLKGSIKRQATLELYETEIEKLYEGKPNKPNEHSSPHEEDGRSPQLTDKVVESVKSILEYQGDLSVDQDLFELGLDSLKALELAKRIEDSFIEGNLVSHSCSAETIYTYPTIEKLVDALSQDANGTDASSSSKDDSQPSREETMSRLVHKYTRLLGESSKSNSQVEPTFVLTGSTGHLGSYVLAQLLARQTTSKVYCFNRSDDAETRQRKRFQDMGLDVEDLLDDRVEFVHCTFHADRLGLSSDQFGNVRRSTTHFIHCAWPVDFKKSLETFEKTAIAGMVNCINFVSGAEQNPNFIFISSIASVGNWPAIRGSENQEHCLVPERPIADNSSPLRQGYGESKHVASCILANAVKTLGIQATVVRVGQLCGPRSASARWKESEWFPALIKSSVTLCKLPSSLGNHSIDWVPIDIAASIIVDISMSRGYSRVPSTNNHEDEPLQYYNLVNPSEADWGDLSRAIQEYYQRLEDQDKTTLETVDLGRWIQDLENASQQADTLPALKLLQFFRSLDTQTGNTLRFSLDNTLRVSPALNDLGVVSKKDMKKWLSGWDFKPGNN